MDNYSIDDIIAFISDKTGCPENEITATSDIVNDIGCSGDDFSELIEDYATKFAVDMSNYLWYFHTEEEGHNNSIGKFFFKAPGDRVPFIPVTPKTLLESANQGKWLTNYPEHTLPKKRYDLLVNALLFVLVISLIIYQCVK